MRLVQGPDSWPPAPQTHVKIIKQALNNSRDVFFTLPTKSDVSVFQPDSSQSAALSESPRRIWKEQRSTQTLSDSQGPVFPLLRDGAGARGGGTGGQNFTQRFCSLCLVHSFALGSSVGRSWEIKEKKTKSGCLLSGFLFCILASVSNLSVFINLSGSNEIRVLEIRLW